MKVFKVAAIAAGGLGLTWAAQQVTGPLLGLDQPGREVRVAQSGAEPAAGPAEETPDAGTGPDASATRGDIEQLSEDEIAEELARIEAASTGENPDELEEFTPSRPLAADLAISLPSDI